MSDPIVSRSAPGATPTVPAEGGARGLDLENLVPGALWRGTYRMGDQLPDITHGKSLRATLESSGEAVVVRSFRVSDSGRSRTWSRLASLPSADALGLVEAEEKDGRRIEVTRQPKGQTLREAWNGRRLEADALAAVLGGLAQRLSELHEGGVAHLNLSPDTVRVVDGGAGLEVSLGGLETAIDIGGNHLVAVAVDPFYAPPEALGLFQHHAGPALRAWDWWSVGRTLQELFLGKHVLALMLDRDVSRRTPELMLRADQVLRDRSSAHKPGGVELMGDLPAPLRTLLRGLLSACRDARWGLADVRAWLEGSPVRERYHLAPNERLFLWKDRAYSVPEAAEHFLANEYPEAVNQILGATDPGTLYQFLGEDGTYRKLRDRVDGLSRLAEASAYAAFDPHVVREVMAALALCQLAEPGSKFRIRGRGVDTAFLRELLSPAAQPAGLDVVEVLVEYTTVQTLAQVDSAASGFLGQVERVASAALGLAARHHWCGRDNRAHRAAMLRWALESEAALCERWQAGRALYAASRDEALDAVFKAGKPGHAELCVLAFTLETPEAYSFVTHDAWRAAELERLHAEARRTAGALSWLHLGRALLTGSHVIGPLPVFLLYWLLVSALLALAYPGRATAAGALVILASAWTLRAVLRRRVRRIAATSLPAESRRLPRSRDCDRAAREMLAPGTSLSLRGLQERLDELNAALVNVSPERAPRPHHQAVGFSSIRTTTLLVGIMSALSASVLGYRVFQSPPTWPDLARAWFHPPKAQPVRQDPGASLAGRQQMPGGDDSRPGAELARPVETAGVVASTGDEASEVMEQVAWRHREPDVLPAPTLRDVSDASPEQAESALRRGESVTKAFRSETITALVAVEVPNATGVALMLYDGRGRKLADRKVYVTGFVPMERAWLRLGERKAIFLSR